MGLSNKIRQFRFKNGEMTQKQLAERVGVSRQTVNAIENGRHAPTIDVAIRMADVFGISVDQLFDIDYEGRPAQREKATTTIVRRPAAAVRESVDVASEDAPSAIEAEKTATFAELQKLIDS